MKRLLNYFDKNLLLKIASLNSVAVITRVIVGFLTSKAIAYYIGPSGMAIVGNLRDFLGSTRSFGSLGFYNGIVKYTAELKKDALQLSRLLSTSFYSVLGISILLSIAIFFSADWLNDSILNSKGDYSYVFRILALALPFYSINLLILAVLNGISKFKFLLKVTIIGQILAGAVTIILIWKYSIAGAMIAIVLAEITVLLVTLIGIRTKFKKISLVDFKNFNFGIIKNLSSYSIMALFSAALLPLAFVFVRNYIAEKVGLDQAGYWEAMNRLSKYYLMFISTLLTLYILPRFSQISEASEFRKEIFNFYKNILPIFAIGLIGIYFFRNYIILLVFTKEFYAVESLFFWQLLGDFLKVISLVISYQLLAKNMLKQYLVTESVSISILVLSSIYYIDIYGVVGATIAHFVTYSIYLVMMVYLFRRELFSTN
ncbi:polysaccharide transporter, PST family [Flavobacteriaceae bacterium MAR_2010_188]|nr:polysaccharide transporter, PST family [Flavobacteriaceae bacterium MAR_2010_188]